MSGGLRKKASKMTLYVRDMEESFSQISRGELSILGTAYEEACCTFGIVV